MVETTALNTRRPTLIVLAPGNEFLHKYFEREFKAWIEPDFVDSTPLLPFAIMVTDKQTTAEACANFASRCTASGLKCIILSIPELTIGTGMRGLPLHLAQRINQGTMWTIPGNTTSIASIHATDVARAAKALADADTDSPQPISLYAVETEANALLEALSVRIKNKRIGSLSSRWARLLLGKTLYKALTTPVPADTEAFNAIVPDFSFSDPAEYLTTHNYDDESL